MNVIEMILTNMLVSDCKEINKISDYPNSFSNSIQSNNKIVLEEDYEFILNGFNPDLNKYTVEEVLTAIDGFNLINPKETLEFILYNNVLDYIQEVKPLIEKIYPNKNYFLEFCIDPEILNLSCLVLSIEGITTPIGDNFDICTKIKLELRKLDLYNKKFIKNFLLEPFYVF